jgi:hypothetical protein
MFKSNDLTSPPALHSLSLSLSLTHRDNILREGFLVFKVYRVGSLDLSPPNQRTPEQPSYRRPYGCAVISLATLDLVKYELGTLLSGQDLLKIYRPRRDIEKTFDNLHMAIIDGPEYDLEEVPNGKGISVSYALISGTIKSHHDHHFHTATTSLSLQEKLMDCPITDHLYHHENNHTSSSIDPKELKEEILITLSTAEFSKGNKSSEKNIELSLWCVSELGEVITHCFIRGHGKQSKCEDQYSTTVYYHNNQPSYQETVILNLQAFHGRHIDVLKCHLLVLASHCSTGGSSSHSTLENVRYSMRGEVKDKKIKKIIAFTFFPLMDSSRGGVIAANGLHILNFYDPPPISPLVSEVNFSLLFDQQGVKRNILSNEHTGIPYLHQASQLQPRLLTRNTFERLELEIHVTSLKYTHIREIHDIIHWTDIPQMTLENSIESCLLLHDDKIYSCVREIIYSTIMILSVNPTMITTFKLLTKALAVFKKRFIASSSPSSSSGLPGAAVPSAAAASHHPGLASAPPSSSTSGLEPSDEQFYSELWSTCVESAFQVAHPTIHLSLLTQLNTILQTIENSFSNLPLDTTQFYRHVMLTIPTLLQMAIQHHRTRTLTNGTTMGTTDPTTAATMSITTIVTDTTATVDDETTFYSLQVVMFSIASILSQLGNKYTTDNTIFQALRTNFFECFILIEEYYEIEAMSLVAVKYIECLHTHTNSYIRSIKKDKLEFMNRLICSKIFASSEEARAITLEWILQVIDFHFKDPIGTGDDKASSIIVLQVLLERFEVLHPEDCEALCPLFESLVQVILKLLAGVKSRRTSLESAEAIKSRASMKVTRRSSCVMNTTTISTSAIMSSLENAACCLTSLIELLGKDRIVTLLVDLETGKELHLSLLVTLTLLIKRVIIPQPWLLLNLLLVNAIGDITSWSSEILSSHVSDYLSSTQVTTRWAVNFVFTKDVDINIDPVTDDSSSSGGGTAPPSSSSLTPFGGSNFLMTQTKETVTNLILWSALINLSFLIILDPGLTLEAQEMNPAKKTYLKKHYNDYRHPISQALLRAWKSIPSSESTSTSATPSLRLKFCSTYTVPALALACSPCEKLSEDGCQLLLDLFKVDYTSHQKFLLTAPLLYDCVSLTVLHNTSIAIDPRYIPSQHRLEIFINKHLTQLFSSDLTLNTDIGHRFVSEMPILLTLLVDLSHCPNTSDYEEERSYAYGKLMDFFLSVRRLDSYIKAAHSLSKEMVNYENHIEAANAILLHMNLLTWSDEMMKPVDVGDDGLLESEPSWLRKKHLLLQAIRLYEAGKAWEYCLKLLTELLTYYQLIRPDYKECSALVHEQARYYYAIATEDRFYPTMFRVGYYGGRGGKSEVMRNKEFIYKGAPLESIIDFSNRIKKKYPNCEVLPPKVTPSLTEHYQSERQFLQISKVTTALSSELLPVTPPVTATPTLTASSSHDGPRGVLAGAGVGVSTNVGTGVGGVWTVGSGAGGNLNHLPSYMKAFAYNFNINLFYYQRPFRKRETKSANEFLDLWVEKKYLETGSVFPNTTRRAEVQRVVTIILNPIEMAISGLVERNVDLEDKNNQMKLIADGQAGQSFTMALRSCLPSLPPSLLALLHHSSLPSLVAQSMLQ